LDTAGVAICLVDVVAFARPRGFDIAPPPESVKDSRHPRINDLFGWWFQNMEDLKTTKHGML